MSYGFGLSLRSARTVLENTIVTAALTGGSYTDIVYISTWTEKNREETVRCPATGGGKSLTWEVRACVTGRL